MLFHIMKNRLFTLFFILFLSSFSVLHAQPEVMPQSVKQTPPNSPNQMAPPPAAMSKPPKSYDDSAEFAKVFKEFYPMVAPKQSMKEAVEQLFSRMSRSFNQQGIDSAEAYTAAMHGLDMNANEKIYFTVYRESLSAKELKVYMAFMKTPEGKHIIEVIPQLQRAASESGNYAQRTIMTNLRPLQQAAREKMIKENPPKEGDKNPPIRNIPGRVMPQRDSLGRPLPPQK